MMEISFWDKQIRKYDIDVGLRIFRQGNLLMIKIIFYDCFSLWKIFDYLDWGCYNYFNLGKLVDGRDGLL